MQSPATKSAKKSAKKAASGKKTSEKKRSLVPLGGSSKKVKQSLPLVPTTPPPQASPLHAVQVKLEPGMVHGDVSQGSGGFDQGVGKREAPSSAGVCGVCDKVIRSNLKRHEDEVHLQLKRPRGKDLCSDCNQAFFHLDRHRVSMHPSPLPKAATPDSPAPASLRAPTAPTPRAIIASPLVKPPGHTPAPRTPAPANLAIAQTRVLTQEGSKPVQNTVEWKDSPHLPTGWLWRSVNSVLNLFVSPSFFLAKILP